MNHLPIHPLSPEEQQQIKGQLYALMGKQVQSYHRHRHMGSNSSVPVELAQELLESIEYTLNLAGGISAHASTEDTFRLGQEILKKHLENAKSLLALVRSTAPQWQTECRWTALRYLQHYLEQYDHLHLAHKSPDDLFYPIPISPPEGIQGIDYCLFYLNLLWVENQIMAGISDDVLDRLWDRLPSAALNQCEQLLVNGIGKAILGVGIDALVFTPEEHMQLYLALLQATEERLQEAADLLCQWLDLKDLNAQTYVKTVVSQILLWTGDTVHNCNLETLFL